MAKYWAETYSGYLSQEIEEVGSLITIKNLSGKFYAKGENINFEEFFSINIGKSSTCYIYETKIPKCFLRSKSHLTGFQNHIIFDKCVIDELIITELTFPAISFTNSTIREISIQNCREIKDIHLGINSEIAKLNINESHVNSLHITDVKFIHSILINKCYTRTILLKNTKFDNLSCNIFGEIEKLELNDCDFGTANFLKLTFAQGLYLTKCKNGNILFDLCDFHAKDILINDCALIIRMYKTRVYEKIIFRINESRKSKVIYDRCYFHDEVLFQGQIAGKEKNLIIKDTVFKELVLFDDDNAICLEIYETLFQKGLLLPIPNETKPESIHSSVWCILKKQAILRNDNITAFHYRKNEMNSYIHELRTKKIFSQEGAVLLLNKFSNNHGISWIRGIGFTLLSWIVSYNLFVLASDDFYCITHKGCKFILFQSEFLANAIDYLWIPQGLKDLSTGLLEDHNWWISIIMVLTFILGKILIAYGIFQTISAFRRHGKM